MKKGEQKLTCQCAYFLRVQYFYSLLVDFWLTVIENTHQLANGKDPWLFQSKYFAAKLPIFFLKQYNNQGP